MDTKEMLHRAQILASQKDFIGAHGLLDDIEPGSADGPLLSFVRGNVMFLEGDLTGAALAYDDALRQDFVHKRLFFNLAGIRLLEGKPVLAAQLYRQAAELDPGNPAPLECLLQLALTNEDFAGAEALAEEMMAACPEIYDGFGHKTDLLLAAGQLQAARVLLAKIEGRFSTVPQYICQCCRVEAGLGRSEAALAWLDNRSSLFNNTALVQMFRRQRVALLLAGEPTEESLAFLREVFVTDQNRQAGFALLGDALGRQDFALAVDIAQALIAGAVQDRFFYFSLYLKAVALKGSGDEVGAKEAFREALATFAQAGPALLETDLGLLPIGILRELGDAPAALAAIDGLTAQVQAGDLGIDKADILGKLAALREEVKTEIESFC